MVQLIKMATSRYTVYSHNQGIQYALNDQKEFEEFELKQQGEFRKLFSFSISACTSTPRFIFWNCRLRNPLKISAIEIETNEFRSQLKRYLPPITQSGNKKMPNRIWHETPNKESILKRSYAYSK